eukprot:GAFH01001405.1.p2 GENE.GAFH01001405.1~~GAFH01001405.1.p2  ORF type:complete len:148 (-),score=35.72 GAFH01001405.1:947-1390(-)
MLSRLGGAFKQPAENIPRVSHPLRPALPEGGLVLVVTIHDLLEERHGPLDLGSQAAGRQGREGPTQVTPGLNRVLNGQGEGRQIPQPVRVFILVRDEFVDITGVMPAAPIGSQGGGELGRACLVGANRVRVRLVVILVLIGSHKILE